MEEKKSKAITTVYLDVDVLSWLKQKENKSSYINSVIAKIMSKEKGIVHKLIKCDVCGAEYSKHLRDCPTCLAKENKRVINILKVGKEEKEKVAQKEKEEADKKEISSIKFIEFVENAKSLQLNKPMWFEKIFKSVYGEETPISELNDMNETAWFLIWMRYLEQQEAKK